MTGFKNPLHSFYHEVKIPPSRRHPEARTMRENGVQIFRHVCDNYQQIFSHHHHPFNADGDDMHLEEMRPVVVELLRLHKELSPKFLKDETTAIALLEQLQKLADQEKEPYHAIQDFVHTIDLDGLIATLKAPQTAERKH